MITAIILFLISIILFCLDFYFVQYAWMNFNDTAFNIAEICLIVFNVAIVVCGVILIKNAANKVKNKKLFAVLQSVVLIAIVIFNLFKSYTIHNSFEQITASASIYAKDIIDGEYFITLINETDTQKFVKMKCDKSTYDKLIADENVQYQIEYRLSASDEGTGSLHHIDTDNYIDNR